MKKIIKDILYPFYILSNNLINNLNLNRNTIVYFDGGLGSQIMSYMQLLIFEKNKIDFSVNIDFFTRSESDQIFKEENTYRKWQLAYFSIELNRFQNVIKTKNIFTHNPKKKAKQFSKFIALKDKYNFTKYFPIADNTISNIKNTGININEDYTAIHVRRGDFIKFSSLVITDDNFIDFISTVKPILNNNIYIISDSFLSDDFLSKINNLLFGYEIKILTGGDEVEIHAIMRLSKVLITSNSMYSLSAALLQKNNSISIVPKKFFGSKEYYYNKAFSTIFDWGILSK
jgi:hypothetical protein